MMQGLMIIHVLLVIAFIFRTDMCKYYKYLFVILVAVGNKNWLLYSYQKC